MPVTAEREQFIRQEVRIVKAQDTLASAHWGSLARKTTGPIVTSIEAKEDAQIIADQRLAILNYGRQLSWPIHGVEVGLNLAYIGVCPTVRVIDDKRLINSPARVDEIQINFGTNQTFMETWG